jgi:hypothetical protein
MCCTGFRGLWWQRRLKRSACCSFCTRCHRFLELKDRRIRKVDTVFGTVPFRSARIVCCPCETPFQMEYPYSPMTEFVPERATGELLSLEARLSAQMPYRQVVAMMREFLPVRETLNHVTVRNRALRAGARVEAVQPAAVGLRVLGSTSLQLQSASCQELE